jgi:2-polyprenyl-6-methoxyphenol hydroxylase-like FAD-dependent oxidoreductase
MPDPILIVGAGPTGLTAALELGRFGVPVRVVDRLAEPATTSRAIGVQARTLELLRQRGLADELVRLGNPACGGNVYGGGACVLHLDFSGIESRYNFLLFVSQAETERVLAEAVAGQGTPIERGVELVALSQDPLVQNGAAQESPVDAVLRHADGRLEQMRAPWLISAEGAHSRVRATLDLQFEGKTLPEDYALGDLYLDGDLPAREFHIFSSTHGFLAMFPLGERHFRMIASHPLSRPGKDTAPTLAELQAIYDQRSHIPARCRDLAWSSWFRINSRMVPQLRHGRLLLGGDAAHIHSPAGGQGMNTGIQDMINLAWKLALVLRGKAQPSLLETYEQDRLPVMRRTEAMTGLIGSENPLVRSLFNHLGPWIGGAGIVRENAMAQMSQIALRYRDSALSVNYGHAGRLHAGDRVPDIRVRARCHGVWQDETLEALLDPSRFVLLLVCPGEAAPPPAGLSDALQPWSTLVSAVHISADLSPGADEAARARFHAAFGQAAGAFLVRPDGYVGCATGEHDAARHLLAYCRRWLSAAA